MRLFPISKQGCWYGRRKERFTFSRLKLLRYTNVSNMFGIISLH